MPFTIDRHSEIASAEQRLRKMIDTDRPLHETLDELVKTVESLSPSGMLASILILDDERKHLLHGAGPSLPAAYNAAINGIEIGPSVGSCGTAAFHDKTVVVYDIAHDPLWANFKELAMQYGLRACWSTPIHGSDGRVIATFANYYPVVRDPSPVDRELTEMVTRTAAMAIERSVTAKAH